jgi:TPR repeat protein
MRRITILLAALAANAVLAQPATDAAPAPDTLDAKSAETRAFDFWQGRRAPRDPAAAAHWFGMAAEAGRPLAQYMLAEQYRTGTGVARDAERALKLYREAADQGLAAAQMMLGQAYLYGIGGVARAAAAAFRWLRDAARQENPEALFMLSTLYLTGQGVAQDRDFAWSLALRAAALGQARAEATVGPRFLYDPSVRDVEKGLHYLRKSAQSNDVQGAYVLALEYLRGTNLARDPALSVQWMTQAARGLPAASLLLSVLYTKGIGVEPDAARAAELLDAGLAKATPSDKNSVAWTLATGPDEDLRDGALAVRIMEQLTADPGQRSPALLDTLAAAYAEAGRFEDAVSAQTRAIEALPATVTAEQRSSFERRRGLYRDGRPYREPP